MAGIISNSASNPGMTGGDTSPTNTRSGFVSSESIVLGVTPSGTTYQWAMSLPSGAAPARAAFDDDTIAAPTFTPDVAGLWVLTCLVNGSTLYTMTLSVTVPTVGVATGGFNLLPVTDTSVPAPKVGVNLYYSSTQSKLAMKLPDGTIKTVNTTP